MEKEKLNKEEEKKEFKKFMSRTTLFKTIGVI